MLDTVRVDRTGARQARGLWTLYEPIHAVSYFAPQAAEAFERAGLRGFWRGYFAGRAAPLGPVAAAPVVALFSSFAPQMVERALPSVWDLAAPEVVLRARAAGAAEAIRFCVPANDVHPIVEHLEQLLPQLPVAGRALAAANGALPPITDPFERLWQATTMLREWRGDAHIAALVSHDLAGSDILVLRCALDIDRTAMQQARGWTDEDWARAAGRLEDDSLIADGDITRRGRDLIAEIEHTTDETSVLGSLDEMRRLGRLLHPIAVRCAALLPFPNPIGLVPAWNPDLDPEARSVARP